VRVDIWSDIVCPWCYIGTARFARALAEFDGRDDVDVVHRSFELAPGAPVGETTPVLDMLARKYSMTPAQAQAAEDRVAATAQADGLDYVTGRLSGNTFDAHRVVALGRDHDRGEAVLDAMFRAYFTGGPSIFDADGLVDIGTGAGLDADEVRAVLAGDRFADVVRADEQTAQRIGISGVPFFLIDGRLGVSGAQPVELLVDALRQSAAGPDVTA
jgi:predicted DsbA family dithiol-disulfide isomerase